MTEYGTNIDLNTKVKLFKEWLDNGGLKTIWSKDLLKDLIEVKEDSDGNVIPETVSSLVNAAMLAYAGSQMSAPFFSGQHISEYTTTLQKALFFNQVNIDTVEQFDEIFKVNKGRTDVLFRGVSEAKWRLYSALQRHWLDKKLYESENSFQEFIENLVSNARIEQGGVLTKFLQQNQIDPNNDIAVLSFLQHYGCPTPLLDWTYNFLNAIYFALDGIKPGSGTKEIEDYFSVYHIEEKYFSSSSLKGIIEEGLQKTHGILKKQVIKNTTAEGVAPDQVEKIFSDTRLQIMAKMLHGKGLITHMTKIKALINMPISYFSDYDVENDLQFSLNNNLNIVNQHSAFTWNADPVKPLEQMGNEQVAIEHGNADGYIFCSCYNIRKSLEDYVRKKIETEGINKDYIYPDPKMIARDSFEKSKKPSS